MAAHSPASIDKQRGKKCLYVMVQKLAAAKIMMRGDTLFLCQVREMILPILNRRAAVNYSNMIVVFKGR